MVCRVPCNVVERLVRVRNSNYATLFVWTNHYMFILGDSPKKKDKGQNGKFTSTLGHNPVVVGLRAVSATESNPGPDATAEVHYRFLETLRLFIFFIFELFLKIRVNCASRNDRRCQNFKLGSVKVCRFSRR